MKNYVDILVSGGQNISDDEVITYIFDGLDSDYDPIVASITPRLESKYDKLTHQQTQYLLQKHEQRLDRSLHYLNSNVSHEFSGATVNSVTIVNQQHRVTPSAYVAKTESPSQKLQTQPPISQLENLSMANNPSYPKSQLYQNSIFQPNTYYPQFQSTKNTWKSVSILSKSY